MKCKHIIKHDAPMLDMKLHTLYICGNRFSDRYKKFSTDTCKVCKDCLLHQNKEE